jgi:hypothetical protein
MLPLLINKILPTKLEHTVVEKTSHVTPDQLEAINLTTEQIKKLAGLSDEPEDAEIVTEVDSA